jgi:hypothetical protein
MIVMVTFSHSRRRLRLSLVSVAALLTAPAAASADPLAVFRPAPAVPMLSCTGPDCPAGEGFLGDAPAHMAIIAEADLGISECGEGGCEYEEQYDYEDESRENPADEVTETSSTGSVADAIDAARAHCESYSVHWRVDCLSSELRAVADRLSRTGDGAVIRAELIKASDELARIAAANAYAAQPPVVRRSEVYGATKRTNRPIRSIAAARLPAANAAATAVLDNLSTTLLRSAPSAAARKANFERAAQAVDSAKVLLRSA